MIYRFVLDPDLFKQAQNIHGDDGVWQQHVSFLEGWREYGLLLGDYESKRKLLEEIKKLDQNLRKKWQEALKNNEYFRYKSVSCVSNKQLWNVKYSRDVKELNELIETIYVDQDKKGKILQEWDYTAEVCSFNALGQSRHYNHARSLDSLGIQKGTNLNDLWDKYFGKFVENSPFITIVDRYSISNWLGEKGKHKKEKLPGLEFVLKKIATSDNPITVKIYSSVINKDKTKYSELLEKQFNQIDKKMTKYNFGNIRKLKIILLHDSNFRDHAHFRFLRFKHTYITTDKGVSAFDSLRDMKAISGATLKRYTNRLNVCAVALKELEKKITSKKDYREYTPDKI